MDHGRVRHAPAGDAHPVGRAGGGRGQEIQRLIGRSLRAAIDPRALGPRQITIDCDVIQADGGTRTAAITGGYVALALAVRRLQKAGKIGKESSKGADPPAGGGHLRRDHRRRSAGRSAVRRGLEGGGRLQLRDDRRRSFRRDPGDRREGGVLGRAVRLAGGAGSGGEKTLFARQLEAIERARP